jgi:hypothetical protein
MMPNVSFAPELNQLRRAVSICEEALTVAGIRAVAVVWDSRRAADIAILDNAGQAAILRCVERAEPADHLALTTMIDEGDFSRAALVYCDANQPHLSDTVESWPIAEVSQFAASLAGKGYAA